MAMIQVTVGLPSGRHETLLIPEPFKVEDLRMLAKKTFGQGFLKLVTGQGDILQDPRQSLTMVGAPEGDLLTAIAREANVASAARAFALWFRGGDKIATRGFPEHGGDSSNVQDQIRSVQQVHSTARAFAATLEGGSFFVIECVWW